MGATNRRLYRVRDRVYDTREAAVADGWPDAEHGEWWSRDGQRLHTGRDDLYVRMGERPDTVRVSGLLFAGRLVEDGQWLHPNLAANQVYHLMSRLGMDVTGY